VEEHQGIPGARDPVIGVDATGVEVLPRQIIDQAA